MKRVPKASVPLERGEWNAGGFFIWSINGTRQSKEAHLWRHDKERGLIVTACGCEHYAPSFGQTAWGSAPTCKGCRAIQEADHKKSLEGGAA
jgi:hypothetical protein